MSIKVNKSKKQISEVAIKKQIISRLNKAEGQTGALIKMTEDDGGSPESSLPNGSYLPSG